ncbi:MAG: ferritin family protein [Desulfobacterales bacterium]|nr:ferritin family protein [Desulfobacterales bacterium]
MAVNFNANEVFEIAKQIEINGAKFYRDAAELVKKSEEKDFLLSLAAMEDDHEQTFADMQKELMDAEKAATAFDPDNEGILYLKALADTRVFFEKEAPVETMKDILTSAITAEKDSISFYLGMKELVTSQLGKDRVDDIIKEEMGHIKLLAGKLLDLSE